jgi:hypothetical protein
MFLDDLQSPFQMFGFHTAFDDFQRNEIDLGELFAIENMYMPGFMFVRIEKELEPLYL